MHRFSLNSIQLWNPLPNILTIRVKLLALKQTVEDAKVGLSIDAGRGGKAPSTVVGSKIAVDQVEHKVLLAEAPVEEEVFREERGNDHAASLDQGHIRTT